MSLPIGFNHVAIVTKDLDRLGRFYSEVFEAETVWSGETPLRGGIPHAFIELNPTTAIHAFELPEEHVDGLGGELLARGRVDHFALSVPDGSLLEKLRARLVEGGYSPGTISRFGSVISLYFEDPDGMPCEVCCLAAGSRGFADCAAPEPSDPFWSRNDSDS
ncbi:MAG: VOC family protein [Actinomycetota bacterium]|nr:VOC family protein [Actinomycetota bacterium]